MTAAGTSVSQMSGAQWHFSLVHQQFVFWYYVLVYSNNSNIFGNNSLTISFGYVHICINMVIWHFVLSGYIYTVDMNFRNYFLSKYENA